MSCLFFNKDPLAIVNNMSLYLQKVPPDCLIFSSDGFELSIHKEMLYQTKFMRRMLKSSNIEHNKIEILCPNVTKLELEIIIEFLYNGKIYCVDQTVANQIFDYLIELFGFPSHNFDFNGTVLKREESYDFNDDKVSSYFNRLVCPIVQLLLVPPFKKVGQTFLRYTRGKKNTPICLCII